MSRLDNLRARMTAEGIDLAALAPRAHLEWLTGLHPHADERPLLYVATLNNEALLMPSLEVDSLRQHTDATFFEWTDDQGPTAAFDELLSAVGASSAGTIALDECKRADHAGLVQDRLASATRFFTETTVGAMRMSKDADEYTALKRNARTADIAMQAAWSAMRPGMTEADVADVIYDSFKEQGVKPLFAIVGAGGNGAFPHHHTGASALELGDAVVMDLGGGTNGYADRWTRYILRTAKRSTHH